MPVLILIPILIIIGLGPVVLDVHNGVAAFVILVVMGLALVRAFKGPSLYDRILAVNNFGTKTVLLLAIMGFLTERPEFLDIAIVYALINFISVIAVLRFVEYTGRATEEETEWKQS
jgi:multicomponent Na+:H+ antiporter subunit F